MVESQRRALDALGVGRLAAVVGASIGGMQALQWAVSHPARMDRVVAMTPMVRTSRWSQLVNEMSRRALFPDAGCCVPRSRASSCSHAAAAGLGVVAFTWLRRPGETPASPPVCRSRQRVMLEGGLSRIQG